MRLTWWNREAEQFDGDDADESIIDALNRRAPNNGAPADTVTISTQTMPIAHVPYPPRPNPPSRRSRPELHVTGPQRARPYVDTRTPPEGMHTPPEGVRPVRRRGYTGKHLRASRDTLPLFRETARFLGWGAVMPPPKPALSFTGALRSIDAYCDKTMRVVCQRVGQAKGELWERARDYDLMEAEIRSKRPLTNQVGM